MKSLSKIKLLIILLLTGTTLSAQDIQRFLGSYYLMGECMHSLFTQSPFTVYRDVVITESNESDLLIFSLPGRVDSVIAFVSNDSLFIPQQWQDTRCVQGSGKVQNDSIFLFIAYDDTIATDQAVTCNCKGKNKNTLAIEFQPEFKHNQVYYDATNQIFVIDETLKNQNLQFELIDMQGKVLFRQTNVNDSFSVTNLPNGMYLYRLLENSQMIFSGKILK